MRALERTTAGDCSLIVFAYSTIDVRTRRAAAQPRTRSSIFRQASRRQGIASRTDRAVSAEISSCGRLRRLSSSSMHRARLVIVLRSRGPRRRPPFGRAAAAGIAAISWLTGSPTMIGHPPDRALSPARRAAAEGPAGCGWSRCASIGRPRAGGTTRKSPRSGKALRDSWEGPDAARASETRRLWRLLSAMTLHFPSGECRRQASPTEIAKSIVACRQIALSLRIVRSTNSASRITPVSESNARPAESSTCFARAIASNRSSKIAVCDVFISPPWSKPMTVQPAASGLPRAARRKKACRRNGA